MCPCHLPAPKSHRALQCPVWGGSAHKHASLPHSRVGWEGNGKSQQSSHIHKNWVFFNLPPVERSILNSLGITGIILKEALEGQE